jgi:hypothetical protein
MGQLTSLVAMEVARLPVGGWLLNRSPKVASLPLSGPP